MICILSTIILIGYGIYQYHLDQDAARINFRNYHEDKKSIYPATTVCFEDPLDEDKFHNRSLKRHYEHYLAGRGDANMVDGINYDDVSKAFHDHLLNVYIVLSNYTTLTYNLTNTTAKERMDDKTSPRIYVSGRSSYYKCWTFKIPFMSDTIILKYGIQFRNTIFPKLMRPKLEGFNVSISYPGQYLTSRLKKTHWDVRSDHRNKTRKIIMHFNVQNIVVLQLRNKRKKPCNAKWHNNDNYILGEITKKIKCKPLHWKIKTDLPTCTSRSQMKRAHEIFDRSSEEDFTPSCRRLEKILYSYTDITEDKSTLQQGNNTDVVYEILVEFEGRTYMEVEHVREISFHSMAGNAGGYLGLFLGWALAHLPESVEKGVQLLMSFTKTKTPGTKIIDKK